MMPFDPNNEQPQPLEDSILKSRHWERQNPLLQSEEGFGKMFALASVGLAQADPATGQWLCVNQQLCNITGYSSEEMVRMKISEITHPDDRQKDWDAFQSVIRGEAPHYQLDKRHIRRNGEVAWVNVNMTVIRDLAGHPTVAIATIEDITERKKAENEVKRLSQWLLKTQRISRTGGWAIDIKTSEIWVSPEARRVYGIGDHEPLTVERIQAIPLPEYRSILNTALQELISAGKPYDVEFQIRHGTNKAVVDIRSQAEYNAEEFTVLGVIEDITERKQSEMEIEQRLRALTRPLDQPGNIVFQELFDLSTIQRIQDEFAAATGVASLITAPDGTPLTRPSNFYRLCGDIIRGTEKGLSNCRQSDATLGRYNPDGPILQPCLSCGLWDAGVSIAIDGRHVANWLIGQVRDETLTEDRMREYARQIGADESAAIEAFREVPVMSRERLKQVAQALFSLANQLSTTAYQNVLQARFITEQKRARERSAKAFKACPEAMTITSMEDGTYIEVNDVFLKKTGFQRDEIIGRTSIELGVWCSLNDRQRFLNEFSKHGSVRNFEVRFRMRSGELRDCLISSEKIELDGKQCSLNYIFDVTERKQMEAQLLRSQRMDTIGAMAGGIAHDLNNILAPILMASATLRYELRQPDSLAVLAMIEGNAKRGANIIQQLLAFTRGKEETAVLDPKHLVREMAQIALEIFPKAIRVITAIGANGWSINANATQLHQVLLNLCVNARDAMPNGGTLTLGLKNTIVDDVFAPVSVDARPGNYIQISVTDTGTGIAGDIQDKIFEPFFTTKAPGHGTGLGLAAVQQIVRKHDGFIHLYSKAGVGTTFSVYIPAVLSPLAEVSTVNEKARQEGSGECVLIVDDEPSIRFATQKTLQANNYRVLTAENGAEALKVYDRDPAQVNLVILDMMMPVMGGIETLAALRQRNPKLKVIISSGILSIDQENDPFEVQHPDGTLFKPYSAVEILATVDAVLHDKRKQAFD